MPWRSRRGPLTGSACLTRSCATSTAWFHAGDWMMLLIALLSRGEFRAAMASRERLRAAAAAMADRSARAGGL